MILDGTFFIRLRRRPRGIHFIGRFPALEVFNLSGFLVLSLHRGIEAFIG